MKAILSHMKASCKNIVVFSLILFASLACKKNPGSGGGDPKPIDPGPGKSDVDFYLTTGNQTSLLQKQTTKLAFGTTANYYPDITVDSVQTYQTIDGFGFCLTDASA